MGVMVDLPTVGRHQAPGEQPTDETRELLSLAGGELVPKGRDRRGRDRPLQGRDSRSPEVQCEGALEKAQQIAAHESPKTTKLYDRTSDQITLDEIERIVI